MGGFSVGDFQVLYEYAPAQAVCEGSICLKPVRLIHILA